MTQPTRSQIDAMRALPAAFKAANNAAPCTYCDDTGDVHSIDGEWRGRCVCPAGEYPTTYLQGEPHEQKRFG